MCVKMKISVVVPVYNADRYLQNCFKSLTEQTLWIQGGDQMELIFVDDASADNSLNSLTEFRNTSPERITVISLKQNRGPGGARNAGMAVAQGEYIAFMDCDDLIKPAMYESMYQKAAGEPEQPDLVDSGVENEADGTIRFYTAKDVTGFSDVQKKSTQLLSVGYVWSRIYRRKFLEENRIIFRENAVMEDQDFLSEVIVRAEYITVVDSVFYEYRNVPDSASKRDAESDFFASTLATIQATYSRLRDIPCYEGVRMAVEYTFWQLCLLNLQTIEAYADNLIIDENMKSRMLKILLQVMKKYTDISVENNIYVQKLMPLADQKKIQMDLF